MAESFFKTNSEANDLAQDDPFAELTRIMGHDPRSNVPLRPKAPEVAEGLALDLENELMGDLGQDEPGPGHPEEGADIKNPDDWRYALAEPVGIDADFERSLDALLDGTFDDQAGNDAASFEPYPANHDPDPVQDYASELHSGGRGGDTAEMPFHDSPEQQEEAAVPAEESVPFDYARAMAERPQFLAGATIEPAQETNTSPYSSTWDVRPSVSREEDAPETVSAIEQYTDAPQEAFAEEPESSFADDAHPLWDAAEPQQQLSDNDYDDAPAYSDYYQPEIETIEVGETSVAVADPLDIPDVPYREEVKPVSDLDEIEEILAGAFGEIAEQAESQAEVAPVREEQPSERLIDEEFIMAGLAAGAGPAAAASMRQASEPIQEWSSRYEDPAQLTPMPGVQPPVASRRLRMNTRLLMTAAVIGGVAILGGVAFFALSSGGTGEPVLLAADNSPVKVRPENPGGVQIPNQENPVYQRVAGEQADAPNEQPRLVSATEEPLTLPLPDEREFGGGTGLDEDGEAATTASAGTADSDVEGTSSVSGGSGERLTNTTAEDPAERELVTVTPRRVRTLVVRPDGSMVPAELPQVAQAEQAALASDATIAESGAAAAQPSEAQDTGASVPRTGPIPPSRPGNIAPQQNQQTAALEPLQVPAQPAAEAPQPQQVAALPNQPPVTSASTSEWSVQIASQPSVEDAQKSYQQLAQRYGNVLQGKGVNIVKADIEGKGTYYRVRIPSSSKEAAIELCTQLKSAGGTCFVSK